MAEEQGAAIAAGMPTQLVRSPHYRLTYANAFGVKATANDAALTFLVQTSVPGLPAEVMQEEVTVTMTMTSLKCLHLMLARVIPAVEQALGPIKVPESALPNEQYITQLTAQLKSAKLVE